MSQAKAQVSDGDTVYSTSHGTEFTVQVIEDKGPGKRVFKLISTNPSSPRLKHSESSLQKLLARDDWEVK